MAQKKILVVDDEADCRTVLKAILEDEGYEVITASDSHEGVEKADAEFPDLVILDVMMETYTAGSNAVARLRESKHTKDIPIILSTALELGGGDSDEPGAEKPMQAQDYIRKPVDPERLIKSVKNLIGASQAG